MTRGALLALALVAVTSGSCRTAGDAPLPPPALDIAAAALDLGEPLAVERELEPLLADEAPDLARETVRQAFAQRQQHVTCRHLQCVVRRASQ